MDNTSQVTVYSTTDYGRFGRLHANRELSRSHVRALARELEENGNFTETNPVVVNQNMEVVDGQHRLRACQELGLPVFYKVVPDLSINEARRMNLTSKLWQTRDFLRSYVDENRRPYVEFDLLFSENSDIAAITTVIYYAVGAYRTASGSEAAFRRGELEGFNLDEARVRMNRLREAVEANPWFKSKTLSMALLELMRSSEYDHARMIRKLNQNTQDIRPFQSVVENMRMLEDIYNLGSSSDNRARLF